MCHPTPIIWTLHYDTNLWFAYVVATWKDGTRSMALGNGATKDEAVAWAKQMATLTL